MCLIKPATDRSIYWGRQPTPFRVPPARNCMDRLRQKQRVHFYRQPIGAKCFFLYIEIANRKVLFLRLV